MKILNIIFSVFILFIASQQLNAQIGYQVSLLNSATGEPRAGETVNVSITLTNSANATIYSQTQSATTNDFGILSLAIGNANTFNNVDWSKLPFFISAYVEGKLIGRSQILTVPVAEYAKKARYTEYAGTADYAHRTGVLTKAMLEGTWIGKYGTYKFDMEGKCKYEGYEGPTSCVYYIDGNHIHVREVDDDDNYPYTMTLHYIPQIEILTDTDWDKFAKQSTQQP